MQPSAFRKVPLLLFTFALLATPLLVSVGRTLYWENYLQRALATCTKKPTHTEAFFCYREAIQRGVKVKGPRRVAKACAQTKDPLCFEAFAQEAPNDSWCSYAREHGWFAYRVCLIATCGK